MNFQKIGIGILCLSLLLFNACGPESPGQIEDYSGDYEKRVEITLSHRLEFSIDSTFIVDQIKGIVPFREAGENYLAFFSGERLFFYKIGEPECQKVVKLETEGPNSVGALSEFDAVAISGWDSIFFINHFSNDLFLLDGAGNVVKKEKFLRQSEHSAVYGYNLNPARVIGNRLYVPAYGFKDAPDLAELGTCTVLNLNDGASFSAFPYPAIYDQYYWGYHTFMRWSSFAFDPRQQTYFVSFAVDPNIYIYNRSFRLTGKKLLGSDYVRRIAPQDNDPFRRLANEGRTGTGNSEYFLKTSFFFGAAYHEGLDYFLRVVRIGKDESIGQDRVRFSVIIADRDLNKMGEYLIPDYYVFNTLFLTEDGFAFLNIQQYSPEENKMVFDVLKPEKLAQ